MEQASLGQAERGDGKIEVRSVTLPKGGGSIDGMGEMLRPVEFNGTAQLAIPIKLSGCREAAPELSLQYSSASGNGPFGLGFQLTLPSLTRQTSKGVPRYTDADVFRLDGAILVPIAGSRAERSVAGETFAVTRFRLAVETAFSRIEHWRASNPAASFWRIIDRHACISWFGRTPQARIADPANATQVFEWLPELTVNPKGDAVHYQYKHEDDAGVPGRRKADGHCCSANAYPARIRYGNHIPLVVPPDGHFDAETMVWHFEVVFDYGEYNVDAANDDPYQPVRTWSARPDPFSTYMVGFERRTHRLCRNVLLFHRFVDGLGPVPRLVRALDLVYDSAPTVSLLTGLRVTGYRFRADGTPGRHYAVKSEPPLTLDYYPYRPDAGRFVPLTGQDEHPVAALSRPPLYSLADLAGEGVPGILYADGRTALYRAPQEGKGGALISYSQPAPPVGFPIERTAMSETLTLTDLAGDGRLALVNSAPERAGFYATDGAVGWSTFRSFDSFPLEMAVHRHAAVDVTGDGRPDAVLIERARVRYYPSRGQQGYGAAVECPVTNDVLPSEPAAVNELVAFVDLLGSGTRHRVRVTNGRVECWPNLGYGRFGARIELAAAPRFEPDLVASRVFFADLDGSGTADLIYAYADRVEIFRNLSGNAFARVPITVKLPAAYRVPAQIQFADVLGSGGQCLVFTDDGPSPRHWYYDFCNGQKSYLLRSIDNGRGLVTTITYDSSARFQLRDKTAGVPWITRLPMPVQVVGAIDVHDRCTGLHRLASYSYRHGYFDPVEREFRGFAYVEKRDSEAWDDGSAPSVQPSVTRSWYHTGFTDGGSLTARLAAEFFQQDVKAPALPEPSVAPPGGGRTDPETLHQGFGALAGSLLRHEIYSRGEETAADAPLAVLMKGYLVRVLQEKGAGPYASFHVHERERLELAYEGDASDPRLMQWAALVIDDYGNVLRACTLHYPRRPGKAGAIPEQAVARATASVSSFAPPQEDPDTVLFGLIIEERTLELANLAGPGDACLGFDLLAQRVEAAVAGAKPVNWRRIIWQGADGGDAPPGGIAPQALQRRRETAVFDAAALARIFANVPLPGAGDLSAFLVRDGGYVERDGYLWDPGLTQSYGGRDLFYQVQSTADQFALRSGGPSGTITTYEYDPCGLLLASVTHRTRDRDVLDDRTAATRFDYCALQPLGVMDANGVVSEAITDPLGQLAMTSRYGKERSGTKSSPVGFVPLAVDAAWAPVSAEALLADPASYLGGAASYVFHDLASWAEGRGPARTVFVTATAYPGTDARPRGEVEIKIEFADGFGHTMATASLAAGGEAVASGPDGKPQRGPDGRPKVAPTKTRWRVADCVAHNGRDKAFREFLPYYRDTWRHDGIPALVAAGLPAKVSRYDALDRPLRVETPKGELDDGFFSRVTYRPWEQVTFDRNDTVTESAYYLRHINDAPGGSLSEPERQALVAAAACANTPTSHHLRSDGQAVRIVARLRREGASEVAELTTRQEFDIAGRLMAVADPRLDAKQALTVAYDLSLNGKPVRTVAADAGTSYELNDAAGRPMFHLDARGVLTMHRHDGRGRVQSVEIQDTKAQNPTAARVVEAIVYGDSADGEGAAAADLHGTNLRGRIYLIYDPAGREETTAFTIDGQPLTSTRRLCRDFIVEPNWNTPPTPGSWKDRLAGLEPMLVDEPFVTNAGYDALGRMVSRTDAARAVHATAYDVGGQVCRQAVTMPGEAEHPFVLAASYDARARREHLTLGDAAGKPLLETSYRYAADTGRLSGIRTVRLADGEVQQNLAYTYDPHGNVTRVEDDAAPGQGTGAGGRLVDAARDYTYDALYRLTKATGRCHPALTAAAGRAGGYDVFFSTPSPAAPRRFVQNFRYDDGGNPVEFRFVPASGGGATGWTRNLAVDDRSNRAVEIDPAHPAASPVDRFDAAGNQIKLNGLSGLRWDYRGKVRELVVIERSGDSPDAVSDTQILAYDRAGTLRRKVTRRLTAGGPQTEETIYLGGIEITRRRHGDALTKERWRWRLGLPDGCVMERLVTKVGKAPEPRASRRYRLDDLLGSAVTELDDASKLVSHEEYAPFGTTVYATGASLAEVSRKIYRFHGKERDGVTGLCCFDARHYVPWIGRWLSPDPAGIQDGLNLYGYARNNPASRVDPSGMDSKPTTRAHATPRNGAPRNRERETCELQEIRARARDAGGSEEDDPETFRRWHDFWNDQGGATTFIQRPGVPYVWYDIAITNNEQAWTFAWVDTQAHEAFHAFVGRVFPLTRYFSMLETNPVTRVLAASLRQFEETIAYTIGHAAALRPHGVAVGWLEAFTTLSDEHQRRTLFVGGFLIGAPAFAILSAASLVYLAGVGLYEAGAAVGRGIMAAGRAVAGGIRQAWAWLTA
jgi:insecticidal toxin complex protein TccC